MQERLEAYEESEQALLSESNSKGVSYDRLCLLPDPCKSNSKRAVEMWTGFLYGQPLWTDRGKNKVLEDLWDSIVVYNFAGAYKHDWAQDAALDAIRQMLADDAMNMTTFSEMGWDKWPTSLDIRKASAG